MLKPPETAVDETTGALVKSPTRLIESAGCETPQASSVCHIIWVGTVTVAGSTDEPRLTGDPEVPLVTGLDRLMADAR